MLLGFLSVLWVISCVPVGPVGTWGFVCTGMVGRGLVCVRCWVVARETLDAIPQSPIVSLGFVM
jgi:hypothetical protein